MQSFAAEKATQILSKYTGADVRIGNLEFMLPANVKLTDVYLSDLHGDSLAYFRNLETGVSVIPILSDSKIRIKKLELDNLVFNLKQEADGKTNLQFLIDAFTPDSIMQPPDLKYEVRGLEIRNARFTYFNPNGKGGHTGKLRHDSIVVSNINLSMEVPYADNDTLDVVLHNLSAKEQSGLQLDGLEFRSSLGSKGIDMKELELRMPNSYFNIDKTYLHYDSVAQLSKPELLMKHGRLELSMKSSYLGWKDLESLVPRVGKLRNKVYISTKLVSANNNIDLREFSLSYGKGVNLNCNANVSDPATPENAFVYANVSRLHCSRAELNGIIQDLSLKELGLPEIVYNLGDLDFNGNITGFFSNLVAYGRLQTLMGEIRTDIMLDYDFPTHDFSFSGNVATDHFNLGGMLSYPQLETVALDVKLDGIKKQNQDLNGNISGAVKSIVFNDYNFRDIIISGGYNTSSANVKLLFDDVNGNGTIKADAGLNFYEKQSVMAFDLDVDSLNLNGMRLLPGFDGLKISAAARSYMEIASGDDVVGKLRFDSLMLVNNEDRYVLDSLVVLSQDMGKTKSLSIISDLINAECKGQFGFATLASNLQYMVSRQLENLEILKTHKKPAMNDFDFHIAVAPLSDLCYILGNDWCIDDSTFVSGYMNDFNEIVEVRAYSGKIQNNTTEIDSLSFHLHNLDNKFHFAADANLGLLTDTVGFDLDVSLANNVVDFSFGWNDEAPPHFAGRFSSALTFNKAKSQQNPLNLRLDIKPGLMVLGDSLWYVRKGHAIYDGDHIEARHINFESENQYIKIDGCADKFEPDSVLRVDLRDFDLAYLSELLNMPDISLAGKTTGYVSAGDLFGLPKLNADVFVDDFGLNDYPMGDVWATADFNHDLQRIDLEGTILNAVGDTSLAWGWVSPVEQELLIKGDVKDIDLQFIRRYVEEIFADDLQGKATGSLTVGGKFDKVYVTVDAFVRDAMLSVEMLKSKYFFSDSVKMTKDAILFKDITIYDEHGNKGLVDGAVYHNYFKDFSYRIDIGIENCQVMNTTSADMPEFYGTIFATGGAVIAGDEEKVDILVNARPDANSYFAVPISSYSSASDNKFITFVDKDAFRAGDEDERSRLQRERRQARERQNQTKLNVDLAIEATPDIEAQIIMDSHSGDIIRGRGNGNLKVNIDHNTNVKIYGNYEIEEGEYNFSLQGAIRKNFEVADGSVSFDGDPLNGILDINAMYQTSAYLGDLLEEGMLTDVKSRVTRVNCLAHIFGNLQQPQVKFDLQIPNEDDEIQRRVKAMVNTDEMMIQQVVFLLLMNRFYNPQLAQNNGTNVAGSMALSLATATISSQLNYWMSQISQNVNLGINYREDEYDADTNRQFDVNISTNLFNNRLLINSNLGYRYQYGIDNFIGDFNVEYKLNRSGRLRLKAYNQTNDRLYYNLYTQGLGIMYREDFDTWSNLMKYYKEVFRKKTDEEKAAAKEEKEKTKAESKAKKEARKALREDRKARHKQYVAEQKIIKEQQRAKRDSIKAAKDSIKNAVIPPQVFYAK